MQEKVDVVIPAGGRLEDDFAREAGASVKALISLGGQTILARTVSALRESGRVEKIVVVGPDEVREAAAGADEVLGEGASGPQNIFRGLERLREIGTSRRVLIVTGDLPFLSPQVVADFLDACSDEAQVCLPALRRPEFEARFPNVRGEYVRLRDGEWTLGCAFLVDGSKLLQRRAAIESVFEARKSQWAMAKLLGAPFIARWVTKRLATSHIQVRCEQVLGVRGQLVAPCAPSLAFDVDGVEEYRCARAALDAEPT